MRGRWRAIPWQPCWKVTTADQLLLLDTPGCRHELLDGELRTVSNAGWWHGAIAAAVCEFLRAHVRLNHLGCVFAAATGFLLARNPDTVRSPDAAFVRTDRMPKEPSRGHFVGAPDLAVEVTSPSETWDYVLAKVHAWLAHGTRVVWVIESEAARASVFDVAGTVTMLGARDTLRGGDVLPGFAVPIADLSPTIG